MWHTSYIFVLIIAFYRGNCVLVTTKPVSIYVDAQQSVTFRCKVEGSDFYVHTHTPTWYKIQDEETAVATGTRLLVPNGALKDSLTERLEVTVESLNEMGEESVFTLNDVMAQDTGKYECRVDAAEGVTRIQHELHVLESLTSLDIYASANSTVDENALLAGQPVTSGSEFEFDSSTTGIIQCVARANSLEPTVSIYEDGEQRSGHYEHSSTCVWEGVASVMKTKVCTTKRGDDGFRPPGHMSGKLFECKAEIHQEMEALRASITLIVKGQPTPINEKCPNLVYAQEGQEDLELRCEVQANPRTHYVGWRVDTTGIDLTAFNSKEGFSSSDTSIGDHRQEVKLLITKVTSEHFHDYTLILRNSIGETQRKISLQKSAESQAITAGFSIKASVFITAALAVTGVILTL